MRPFNLLLLFVLSVLGIYCQTNTSAPASLPTLAHGQIVRLDSFSSRYVQPRPIDVWLPADYDSTQRYAVLYMHDGQMLFDSTRTWNGQEWGVDEVVHALLSKGSIPPLIVVGIWNGGALRHAEYFPQKPFEMLPKTVQDSLYQAKRDADTPLFAAKVQSDDYLRFLVEEVKPFIDQRFSTLPDAAHTFVMGSSMGGLISMYALCEYPQVFGGAACMSTHWVGTFSNENNPIPPTFFRYLEQNLPAADTRRFYFDYGTKTLDALYEPHQVRVDSIMTQKGYSSDWWQTHKFEGAAHVERAWKDRLDVPIRFLCEGSVATK